MTHPLIFCFIFYNHLLTSIQARGKALQNAFSSLQQLDRAIDRFLGWLTETESNLDALELEANKLGDRSLRQRNWFDQIKVCLFY